MKRKNKIKSTINNLDISSFGNFISITKSLFYGYYSKLSLNGIYSVTECSLSLYWNSTTDNYSIQSSC